jgi:hypothetical protein
VCANLHAVSLLQRLCVGPDGADKLNKWTLGRPLAMRANKPMMMPSRGTHPAITIAFPAAPKNPFGGLWRDQTVTSNRCRS